MKLFTKKSLSPLDKMGPAEIGELFKKAEAAVIAAVGGEEIFEALWEQTRKEDLKAARKQYYKIAFIFASYGYIARWVVTRPAFDTKAQELAEKLVAKLLKRS